MDREYGEREKSKDAAAEEVKVIESVRPTKSFFNRWESYTLVARRETYVQAPGNRTFLLVAEVRTPTQGSSFQLRVGRAHPEDVRRFRENGSNGMNPAPRYTSLFYEDVPAAMELVADVFQDAKAAYQEAELSRITERAERDREELRLRIRNAEEDWRKPLLDMSSEICSLDDEG